jgi:hypothetical protein
MQSDINQTQQKSMATYKNELDPTKAHGDILNQLDVFDVFQIKK